MTMKIGELAKRTGLTASRIRFYERIGLLKGVKRQPNGYRTYPQESIMVLELIASAQAAGFSLDDLRALLPSRLGDLDHPSLVNALRDKIKNIEQMQQQLARSKAQLVNVLSQFEANPNQRVNNDNDGNAADQLLTHFGSLSVEGSESKVDFRVESHVQRR